MEAAVCGTFCLYCIIFIASLHVWHHPSTSFADYHFGKYNNTPIRDLKDSYLR